MRPWMLWLGLPSVMLVKLRSAADYVSAPRLRARRRIGQGLLLLMLQGVRRGQPPAVSIGERRGAARAVPHRRSHAPRPSVQAGGSS